MPKADESVPLLILDYDHERDWEAVKRMHYEVGWLDDEDEAKELEHLARCLDGVVISLDGEAECAVFTAPGVMRHLETDVDMSAVIAVTTSRVARKLGAAKRLTAHALARAADSGSEISALGMFDQGFYNRLGFGNGSYTNRICFDPATLTVDVPFRPPKRIGRDQWPDVHAAMHDRMRGHGGCLLNIPEIARYDMASIGKKLIGLGYYDGPSDTLSHFIWGGVDGAEGPYRIYYYAYQTPAQLFELFALIKSLGDQGLDVRHGGTAGDPAPGPTQATFPQPHKYTRVEICGKSRDDCLLAGTYARCRRLHRQDASRRRNGHL